MFAAAGGTIQADEGFRVPSTKALTLVTPGPVAALVETESHAASHRYLGNDHDHIPG
jgi:hypothetical protein